MAWVFGGKKFGQYTYEHWFDDEYGKHEDFEPRKETEANKENREELNSGNNTSNTAAETAGSKAAPFQLGSLRRSLKLHS